MFTIERKVAMGIILFTVTQITVSYDERKNLITKKQFIEAFTSETEAEQCLLDCEIQEIEAIPY